MDFKISNGKLCQKIIYGKTKEALIPVGLGFTPLLYNIKCSVHPYIILGKPQKKFFFLFCSPSKQNIFYFKVCFRADDIFGYRDIKTSKYVRTFFLQNLFSAILTL